jgi:hypothetical protein
MSGRGRIAWPYLLCRWLCSSIRTLAWLGAKEIPDIRHVGRLMPHRQALYDDGNPMGFVGDRSWIRHKEGGRAGRRANATASRQAPRLRPLSREQVTFTLLGGPFRNMQDCSRRRR